MDHRKHIRGSLQDCIDFGMEVFRQSGLHPPEGDDFVFSEMQYPEIIQLANGFGEPTETFGLL